MGWGDLGDGSVVSWGDDRRGGDRSAVQGQLKDVQQIAASAFAFAAILGDGTVVTWGATAVLSKISSGACSRSKPTARIWLPFVSMGLL